MSPLLSAPCLDASTCFKVDWLHTMDLGVSQDFMGNLFKPMASVSVSLKCYVFCFCVDELMMVDCNNAQRQAYYPEQIYRDSQTEEEATASDDERIL